MGDLEDKYIIYAAGHTVAYKDRRKWNHLLDQAKIIKNLPYDYQFEPDKELTEEERIREKYPAAADAWEKYQAVIKLVKGADGVNQ